jgi:hypothetical protein
MDQLNYSIKMLSDKQFSKMFIEYFWGFCYINIENDKFNYMDSRFIIVDLQLEEILDYIKLVSQEYMSIYLTN